MPFDEREKTIDENVLRLDREGGVERSFLNFSNRHRIGQLHNALLNTDNRGFLSVLFFLINRH